MNEFRGDDQSHEAFMRLYFRSLGGPPPAVRRASSSAEDRW